MKLKGKSSLKFLTDAEQEDNNEHHLTMDSRISTNIKIVSTIKTRPVKKVRKNRNKRRKRFETEDQQQQQKQHYESRQNSQLSQTPVAEVQIERRYMMNSSQKYSDEDLGLHQVQSSQQFINSIKSKLRK